MALTFQSTVSANIATESGGGITNLGALTVNKSTISGNTAAGFFGGGINSSGTLTLTNSTVSGNSAQYGGGIKNGSLGTMTLTGSIVEGNTARSDGGILSFGALAVTNSTISGNTVRYSGGGIGNDEGTVTLTDSSVEGNTATYAGGVSNSSGRLTVTNSTISGNRATASGGGIGSSNCCGGSTVTLTNSTVSGNTAGIAGGGVKNFDENGQTSITLTLSNSTVSGNTAADRGGAVDNSGTMTLTNSTVTANASGRVAGGLFNTGAVTLVQSLLSGNTAPVNGSEAYSVAGQSGQGTVIADGFNVFGYDGSAGIAGFTPGATDRVPGVPLSAILDPTLSYNGGATRTHSLVFGSPAVDAVLGAACATGADQRGAPRAQDGDGDTFADCDSGAVERRLVPVQAELAGTTLACRGTTCGIPVRCNLTEAQCTNEVEVVVRTRAVRAADGTLARAARRIRFATGVTNVPPGGTGQVTLRLTKQGKRLVRATTKKRLKGVLGIRKLTATVSNTPVTINNTLVTIRLRRR